MSQKTAFNSFLEPDCRNEAPFSFSLIPIIIYWHKERSVWTMSFNSDGTRHLAPHWFGSVGKFKPGASNSDTDAAAPEGQR